MELRSIEFLIEVVLDVTQYGNISTGVDVHDLLF